MSEHLRSYGLWIPHHCLTFFFWLLYCLSFFNLRMLLSHLISSNFSWFLHSACRSLFVILFYFCWPLCCMSFEIRILIAPLVSSNSSLSFFGHCVVCSSIYGLWLPFWYFQTLLCSCLFGHCVLRILTTPFVSSNVYHCVVCPSSIVFWLPLLVSSNSSLYN